MVECICRWAFTQVLEVASERSGLKPGWAYIAKAVFDTVPKFYLITIRWFYSNLDQTEMSS